MTLQMDSTGKHGRVFGGTTGIGFGIAEKLPQAWREHVRRQPKAMGQDRHRLVHGMDPRKRPSRST